MVLTEVTSDPKVGARVLILVAGLPLLTVGDGYWARAGELRRRVLSRGHKARLADTLIAQSCLDHDVQLLTADRDFQRFARATGLRLA